MKELTRRCEYFDGCGVSCGPCCFEGIIHETEIEKDNGERFFLTVSFVTEGGGMISEEITNESIFDYLTLQDDDDEKYEAIRQEPSGVEFDEVKSFYETAVEEICDKMIEKDWDEDDVLEYRESWLNQ